MRPINNHRHLTDLCRAYVVEWHKRATIKCNMSFAQHLLTGEVLRFLPFSPKDVLFLPQNTFLTDGTLRQQVNSFRIINNSERKKREGTAHEYTMRVAISRNMLQRNVYWKVFAAVKNKLDQEM